MTSPFTCAACGEPNSEGARFCSGCGAPLSSQRVPIRQSRKVVTVLFSDVTGFTTISERIDPEALREVMQRYFAAMRDVIERHGGRVEKFIGDAVMAVFGLPSVREDDGLRAVRAAVEIGGALTELNALIPAGLGIELTASTGINTGEVFVSEDPSGAQVGDVIGDAVNVAARLEGAAAPGEVMLGRRTYALTRDNVEAERLHLELKGKSKEVVAYRLVGLSSEPSSDRRLSARTVGRSAEMRTLVGAFEEVSARRGCVLVTVLGAAGTGKSRLIRDMPKSLGSGVRVLSGRCLPYGEASIYWALAEIASQAAQIGPKAEPKQVVAALADLLPREPGDQELAAARLAGALGLAPLAGAPEEIVPDLLRLFRALAGGEPLVVVIEDIHWASRGLLVALEQLAARLDHVPLLLICSARLELLENRPDWPGEAPAAQTVTIKPLTDADCAALVRELLNHSDAAESLAGPVVSIANGNPLVIEEVLAMLVDDGDLAPNADGWSLVREVHELRIPPTIEAILAARLDRLSDNERELIEGAAVIGKEFDRAEIEALAVAQQASMFTETIDALLQKQLIASAGGVPSDYRFHHILVRDAAYAATPKRRRAELHERFADFVEGAASLRAGAYGEIVGEHLERSCLLRRELGAGDDEVGELAHRAGELLEEAGRRAQGLSDLPAARSIYARGEAVLARSDPLRPALLTGLAEALFDIGLLVETQSAARAAEITAQELGTPKVRPRAALARIKADVWRGDLALDDGLIELRRMAEEIDRNGEDRSIVSAWMSLAGMGLFGARFGQAETAASRAVACAGRSAPGELPYCLVGMCSGVSRSPLPLAEAEARCAEALARVQPDTAHAAMLESHLAFVEALSGSFEAARARFARASRVLARYRWDLFNSLCLQDWGMCGLIAGDFEDAELRFRSAAELCTTLDPLFASACAALHARALVRLGQHAEGLEEARAAGSNMGENDVEAQVWWRIAAALALAELRAYQEAEEHARSALAVTRHTEAPLLLGDTLACLGEVLLAQQLNAESTRVLQEAIAAYEVKGIAPAVANARELLHSSATAS
jgi:class 3 adenylate cyclase